MVGYIFDKITEHPLKTRARNAYVMVWDTFCGVIKMNVVSDFNSFKLDKSKIELNTNSIFETDLKGNDSILTSSGLDESKVGQVELIYTTRK